MPVNSELLSTYFEIKHGQRRDPIEEPQERETDEENDDTVATLRGRTRMVDADVLARILSRRPQESSEEPASNPFPQETRQARGTTSPGRVDRAFEFVLHREAERTVDRLKKEFASPTPVVNQKPEVGTQPKRRRFAPSKAHKIRETFGRHVPDDTELSSLILPETRGLNAHGLRKKEQDTLEASIATVVALGITTVGGVRNANAVSILTDPARGEPPIRSRRQGDWARALVFAQTAFRQSEPPRPAARS